MAAQIRLTKAQVADLTALRDAELEVWTALVNRVEELPPHPMLPDGLRETLSAAASPEFVDTLLRQTLSLIGMMLQIRLTADEIFQALHSALQGAPALWDEAALNRWAEREPLFRRILGADAVVGTAKALDLSYDHAQLLRRARILTDIRPIFDREATSIQGAVISHTLRLRYDDLDGEHSISLALDRSDVESLIDECKRALSKCDVALQFVKKTGLPPLVPGNDA
ncbi:MAG: hypothetical protein NTV08_09620 [Verrucomicrobia bacterium]|nr:hypothetical protein [Verrucomicrobiota bacterium]